MAKNHMDITVPVHGGLFHSTCIFITKYICRERGYKLKNSEAFANMSKCPGIPDIFIEYEYKGKDEFGKTRTLRQSVCIEIETNPSNAATLKKMEQFTRPGMREPVIIDVGSGFKKFKKRQQEDGKIYDNDVDCIHDYIDEQLVI